MRTAFLTFDVEPDCLPYLGGFRGMEEGLPLLLQMLREERISATFFTTGEVASLYPDTVLGLVADGHELGCHSMSHPRFTALTPAEAEREIADASRVLRAFAPVTSFRAPYLAFPNAWLGMLLSNGYTVDSSQARYKMWREPGHATSVSGLARVPASVPPSLLRLPASLWKPFLARASGPLVLFAHPWEFVDLRRAPIPLDCRFNTGEIAMRRLREVLRHVRSMGTTFGLLRDYTPTDPVQ